MSENTRLAQAILSQLAYITLSTATKDGVPWNAPVYAAFDEAYTFFWVSTKYARHSQNIRANNRIAIVVYDSTVLSGTGKGVKSRHDFLRPIAGHLVLFTVYVSPSILLVVYLLDSKLFVNKSLSYLLSPLPRGW